MGRALQPPAGISRLINRGLEAAWAPATVVERQRRLLRTRRVQGASVAAYVVLGIPCLFLREINMAIMFFALALMNAANLYGSVSELRKIEKSS